MDVHNCFNRIIHAINPATASRNPNALCQICKFAVREAAVGKFFIHILIFFYRGVMYLVSGWDS